MSLAARILSLAACCLGVGLVPASAVANDPGISIEPGSFKVEPVVATPAHNSTTPLTTAGAHPDININFRLCYPTVESGNALQCLHNSTPFVDANWYGATPNSSFGEHTTDDLKSFELNLPPGLIGNPRNAARCPLANFVSGTCPAASQVGTSKVNATDIVANIERMHGFANIGVGNIYNLETEGAEPARLGTNLQVPVTCGTSNFPILSLIRVRPGDLGIESDTDRFYKDRPGQGITESPIALPLNLAQMRPPCTFDTPITTSHVQITLFGQASGGPFMVNPTSCRPAPSELAVTSEGDTDDDFLNGSGFLGADAYTDAEQPDWWDTHTPPTAGTSFTPTGCDHADPGDQDPPFTPTVRMQPTGTTQAGAPSGHEVRLAFNDSEDDPVHQAHLKEAEVKLPADVGLNAAAALDLDGCTPEQFGFGSSDPVDCPASSVIADVEVTTPVIDTDPSTPAVDPLVGKAYFGKPPHAGPPSDANPWKLFQVIEGSGLRVKLVGDVRIDPDTGQLTTIFKDDPATTQDETLPQTPFTDFKLSLRGGERSILTNPRNCGAHQISAKLTPWSDSGDGAATIVNVENPGFTVTGCSTPEPFSPSVGASASPSQAGANSKSQLEITRPNGQQIIKKLRLSLPAGAVGSLAAVPLCPLGQIQAGSCSSDSQVGTVKVEVGPGNAALPVTGALYLGEPAFAGDAASIGLVIPGKAGPIDLGNVVVVNRVRLRQSDGGIDVEADVPTRLFGIPLPIKQIDIDVDREGFFRNPTGCDVRNLNASFDGDRGATAVAAAATQATGCEALGFSPKLRLIALAKGQTKKGGHPGIKAIVTQPAGESNISSTRVVLPKILRPDTVQINKPGVLCRGDQLAAGACPPQSLVGSAVAHSPLLPAPLSGPVYFVQEVGQILPKLAVMLRGAVSLQLNAANSIAGVQTVNTFSGVPDVPVTRFELNVNGGSQGILKNFNELCANPDKADATFISHSGKSVRLQPNLELEGCGATALARATVSTKRTRVSRKGIVKLKLKCSGADGCNGKLALSARKRKLATRSFEIAAGKTATVRLKLNRKARKLLRKHRRLRARTTTTLQQADGAGTSKTTSSVTLVR